MHSPRKVSARCPGAACAPPRPSQVPLLGTVPAPGLLQSDSSQAGQFQTCECEGVSALSPRGGGRQFRPNQPPRGNLFPLPKLTPSCLGLSRLARRTTDGHEPAISANEWLAGRRDAHLPSHQRRASPLLGSWRSRRWLCSAAPPPALLPLRRHVRARAFVFPLVATYAPSVSCELPSIDGAGVELFTGYGSMSRRSPSRGAHGAAACARRWRSPGAGSVVPPRSRRRDAQPPLFRGGGSLSARCVVLGGSRIFVWSSALSLPLQEAVAVARRAYGAAACGATLALLAPAQS